MKSKIKRHSRSVLSVVLTLCMLVSCMTVGLIATDAARVTDSGNEAVLAKVADDSETVGASADSDEVGAKYADDVAVGAQASDDSEVGARMAEDSSVGWSGNAMIYTDKDSWTAPRYTGAVDSSGNATVYVDLTAENISSGDFYFKVKVNDTWFGSGETVNENGSLSNIANVGSSTSANAPKVKTGTTKKALKLVFHFPDTGSANVNAYLLDAYPVYIYGAVNGVSNWSNGTDNTPTLYEMTYDSRVGAYYYDLDKTNNHYFKFYAPSTNTNKPWVTAQSDNNGSDVDPSSDKNDPSPVWSVNNCADNKPFRLLKTDTKIKRVWFKAVAGDSLSQVWYEAGDGLLFYKYRTNTDHSSPEDMKGQSVLATKSGTVYTAELDPVLIAGADVYTYQTVIDTILSTTNQISGNVFNDDNDRTAAVDPGSIDLIDKEVRSHDSLSAGITNARFARVKLKSGATVTGITVAVDTSAKTYTYSATGSFVKSINVTAKDGAIRFHDGYGPYHTWALIGDTTLSSTVVRNGVNTSITVTDHPYQSTSPNNPPATSYNQDYQTATVNAGDIIHVSTQIDDAHKATHYVKGFVVNGETKKLNTWNSTGLYELDYEVTGEERNGKLEITPVYFLKDESNTINFSIDGFEPALQFNNNGTAKWGDTLYVYPFYENGGKNITGRLNAFGSYPGQPLIFEGGKYYIQIPKTISYTDGDTTKTATVKGVTMSNGFWDHVHRGIMGWGNGNENHRQTYDYDDFYKISKERTPDNITFDFKYRTSVANNGITTNSSYSPFPSTGTFTNGFNDLEDVYGRKIDVFGNLLTTAQQALSPVYVVSKGYHKTNAGDYATEWEIFYPNANTVADTTTWTKMTATSGTDTLSAINPAALVLENSSKFATYGVEAFSKYKPLYEALDTQKDASNNTLVKGHPVKITFEMEVQNTEGDIAQRSDGQWYHSKNNDIIHANIIIEYKNESGNWVPDTFAPDSTDNPTGVTTGASAYFTNEENNIEGQSFYGKRATGDVYSNNKEFFTFAAESSATYKFVGWKRLLNGNYYDITGDAQSPKTTIDTYVARFEPFVGGSLTVKNTVSTAGDYKGSGTSYVKLDVINTNDVNASSVYSTGFVKNSAALDSTYIKENSNKFVRITLKTEPSGEDTFQQFSYKDADDSDAIKTSEVPTYFPNGGTTAGTSFTLDGTTAIKTLVIPISGLFSGGAQKSLLEYFSELNKTELKYELKYKYDGRLFGNGANSQWYVVKGTFTSKEFSDYVTKTGENYYIASSFLLNKKPYERDFMKDITWNYNGASETAATVDMSVANTKTLKLDINQNDDQADSARTAIFTLPYCYNPSTNYGVNEYIPVAKYEERAGSTSGTYYYNMIGYWYTPDDDGFDEYQTEVASWHGDNKPYESIDENSFLPAKHNGIPVKEGSSVPTFDISTVYGKRFVIGDYPEGEAANDEANYNYINAAPSVYNNTSGKVEYFKYWQITNYDGKEIAKCYYNKFNFSAYDNYMIEAVYGEGDPGQNYTLGGNEALGATISFLDSSRNHWNEDGKGTSSYNSADILFKDFAVAYSYKSKILKYYTDEDVRVGVVIERVQDELDTVGRSYYLNMDYYKDKHSDTEEEAISAIKTKLLTNPDAKDDNYFVKKIASNIASDSGYKPISEGQVIDNKNRTKYYYAVYNEANGTPYDNKKRLYRAYSYIMVKGKGEGDTWTANNIAVSEEPVYFAFYDIASK